MSIATVKLNWNEWRRDIIHVWNRRRGAQLTKVNDVRERSISILQKRYGYTIEQATYQLDKHYPRAWLG
jgi:hypothetical protein